MKVEKELELPELRAKFELSNKAWDTSIKTLTKNNLVKVMKEEERLIIKIAD